jgi:hypothetical protein
MSKLCDGPSRYHLIDGTLKRVVLCVPDWWRGGYTKDRATVTVGSSQARESVREPS